MRYRSLTIAVLLVAAVVVMTPSLAFANGAVHGGYTMSTDACAGCHRAHTAASPITWTDSNSDVQSALLISTAVTIEDFCLTCHGTSMPGADTNVWDGIFEADDAESNDELVNAAGEYLNGGGFDPTVYTDFHYGSSNVQWVAWGAGPDGQDGIISRGGEDVDISCSACHDVHGSSNYRILKDVVAGISPAGGPAPITVGGYDPASPDPANPIPTPWVLSVETGYPVGGWLLHEPGAAQVAGYSPDYTDPMYSKPPIDSGTGQPDVNKGISAWCAACHTQYNTAGTAGNYADEVYDAFDGFGLVERHRHPVNVAMSEFAGPRPLVLTGNTLPLAHDNTADAATQDLTDWIDCLTCHVAHGSSAIMTGYADVLDTTAPEADTGGGGVAPVWKNALLRDANHGGGNNRYVCEVCHNK